LKFETEKLASGNSLVKSFLIKGKDILLSGNAEFGKQEKEFIKANFDKILFGKNQLDRLDYNKQGEVINLFARGNSIDLSPYINSNNSKSSINIDIKTDDVVLGENRFVKDTEARAICSEKCSFASINSKLANGNNFRYSIKDGKVIAISNDAGELLRALGAISTIEGGDLTLDAAYNGNNIEGNVIVKDYKIKSAPILTKILTIASLSGIIDTLSGNGITFNKLSAPFNYKSGVIIVGDAKAFGSALGLTAKGTLELATSKIDMSGVIIPSYTINSLVGKIPLIGDLLVGGTGKGILAINYSVKGDSADPSVTVNPLSAFTPGFLRSVFDVFDKPAPDMDKILEDRKKEEEKKRDKTLPSIDLIGK
ncbi:MAG: AsmA-like C-terminal domain-containing protein, partial [Pseudomonadota bacterium]